MTAQKPREIACRILWQHAAGPAWVEDLLHIALERASLHPRDRALVHELVCGVVRWQAALDWLIDQKTRGRKQKPDLRVLLRLGLYQIFWLDRIPDHATVNETVNLARQHGLGAQTGFVNALLRGYARARESTRLQLEALKQAQPAVGWSHPAWLIDRWQARWGLEPTVALLAWNNAPAHTFARANALKTDPGRLLDRWREEDVEYDFGRWDWIPETLVFQLKTHPPLTRLGTFQDGWFYLQDPSTLLAVHALDPQPGDAVLDACAAPGGKTTYIAQRMANQGRIVAQDASDTRLGLLHDNCKRLGITCVQTCLTTDPLPVDFDRILVDAPCSNTGVMRRRIDLRWRIRPEALPRLKAAQIDLLDRAAARLKPGGRLVYSTCSLEPEENQQVARALLTRHTELRLQTERELLPFRDRVDGAYVAVFDRAPEERAAR
ncbi:MAG TPA: 16S rRNA (cytosine(967)-C(5))-methyltransferase RsmB [Verrucomicrobiota bacterium]|nr:16S rRNA (cytosine(967)-C(5))-methyltransferase RsmB [Verrucomicrobiota bacterium]